MDGSVFGSPISICTPAFLAAGIAGGAASPVLELLSLAIARSGVLPLLLAAAGWREEEEGGSSDVVIVGEDGSAAAGEATTAAAAPRVGLFCVSTNNPGIMCQ